ncbi:MAG: DUF427 domain-containing protein [Paracoccaceae bacterium]|jgi:uncharacterized protein (DUF427 family)
MKTNIEKATGTWTVRAGGAVLVESKQALSVSENGQNAVTYFPPQDVPMEFLDAEKTVDHPHLGTVQYYSIVTKSTTLENAAWSLSTPAQDAAALKDYVAFYQSDRVTVEKI